MLVLVKLVVDIHNSLFQKMVENHIFIIMITIITILILISCSNPNQSKVLIGKMNNGEEVHKFLLKNKDCEVEIISLGAINTTKKEPEKSKAHWET